MTESLREVLAGAAKNGEVIRIVYHGGSQPGTVREVHPIVVTDIEMRARDFGSHETKLFKLAKIEIPDPEANPPEYDPALFTRSIKEFFDPKLPELQTLGWRVDLSTNAIDLRGVFENGKPRKTSDVSLRYEEIIPEPAVVLIIRIGLSGDDGQEEHRTSTHRFRVHSRRFAQARIFSDMSKAVALFMEEAHALGPAEHANG